MTLSNSLKHSNSLEHSPTLLNSLKHSPTGYDTPQQPQTLQ